MSDTAGHVRTIIHISVASLPTLGAMAPSGWKNARNMFM